TALSGPLRARLPTASVETEAIHATAVDAARSRREAGREAMAAVSANAAPHAARARSFWTENAQSANCRSGGTTNTAATMTTVATTARSRPAFGIGSVQANATSAAAYAADTAMARHSSSMSDETTHRSRSRASTAAAAAPIANSRAARDHPWFVATRRAVETTRSAAMNSAI